MSNRVDVAIIGSGFSGSILAWILARQGMRVAVIDGASHPRFAIGESSTPIADTILRRLGQTYELPELRSLSTWGTWQRSHAALACGRKRGFSYFVHREGESFKEDRLGERSLLVAASPSDELADTHWYRPDVDQFFWSQAISAGAVDLTGHEVTAVETRDDGAFLVQYERARGQDVRGQRTRGRLARGQRARANQVSSRWVIDASGRSGVLAKQACRENLANRLRTRTCATFAHYRGVAGWSDIAAGQSLKTNVDPFDADDAAQHHLLDHGWVWMLRFNNGITSVGYTAKLDQPAQSLDQIVAAYPSLSELMKEAILVAPSGGPACSGRLQRWFDPVVDSRRIMLPTAAVTLDPLHSTGIAHALAGVERACRIITCADARLQRDMIDQYRKSVLEETVFLDSLVSTAYETLGDFDRFTAACMLYFAGAIRCEERYQRGESPSHLWNADDIEFVSFVDRSCQRLLRREADVVATIRREIEPWNSAGLMNAGCGNRYAYTATKTAMS